MAKYKLKSFVHELDSDILVYNISVRELLLHIGSGPLEEHYFNFMGSGYGDCYPYPEEDEPNIDICNNCEYCDWDAAVYAWASPKLLVKSIYLPASFFELVLDTPKTILQNLHRGK